VPHAGRVGAIALAYCDNGLEQPGHYRMLFGTTCALDAEQETMPGSAVFALLRDEIARAGASDAHGIAVALWALLHGLVTLRASRPAFPWPPLDALIDRAVAAHLAEAVTP
ncbi:MAG: TetR-like C-terminal domain-containing protein, partial [Actinomycetes bacterium]